jgi:hypothetical protein
MGLQKRNFIQTVYKDPIINLITCYDLNFTQNNIILNRTVLVKLMVAQVMKLPTFNFKLKNVSNRILSTAHNINLIVYRQSYTY